MQIFNNLIKYVSSFVPGSYENHLQRFEKFEYTNNIPLKMQKRLLTHFQEAVKAERELTQAEAKACGKEFTATMLGQKFARYKHLEIKLWKSIEEIEYLASPKGKVFRLKTTDSISLEEQQKLLEELKKELNDVLNSSTPLIIKFGCGYGAHMWITAQKDAIALLEKSLDIK